MQRRNVWLRVCAAFVLFGSAACQVQTTTLNLCEALQQQGSDATCWLRHELKPGQLVTSAVLFNAGVDSLESVLRRVGKETGLQLKDGTEFENDAARFVVRCVPGSGRNERCVWTLVSNPKGDANSSFEAPLLEAVDWVRARTSSPFKLALHEKQNVQRSLTIEIKDNKATIEWADSEVELPQ